MQQQSEANQLSEDFRAGVNWLYLLANTHATCLTMFIRCDFGINMPGVSGVLAVLMMLFYAAGSGDIRVQWLLYAWFAALVCQRLRTAFLHLHGHREHSEYSGWPWLGMLFPLVKSEVQAKNIEPALCLPLGACLCAISPAMGAYVMVGFLSLTIVRLMHLVAIRRRVTAMRDLAIEQQIMSERLRGLRNDF